MGTEFTEFSLLDVYAKTNPNKITQKYGCELLVKVDFSKDTDGQMHQSRNVEKNPDYVPLSVNPEEEE